MKSQKQPLRRTRRAAHKSQRPARYNNNPGTSRHRLVRDLVRRLSGYKGCHILAAVSGGADSTAMLLGLSTVARQLRLMITVAHLNHGIRGKEADADATWVQSLARQLGFPCVVGKTDLKNTRLRRRGESLEMAARRLRYDFLVKTARKTGAACVVTAHTADDQAETVLMMLARGCGAAGLAGIPIESSVCGIKILRPLLDVSRADIIEYLNILGKEWREDSTNMDMTLARNRIRHAVLPLLRSELNPRISEALCRVAAIARESEAWMDSIASRILQSRLRDGNSLHIRGFPGMPAAARKRVLRMWLRKCGVPAERISFNLLEKLDRFALREEGSAILKLPGRLELDRRYNLIRVTQAKKKPTVSSPLRAAIIKVPGTTMLRTFGLKVVASIRPGLIKDRKLRPGIYPAQASLSIKAATCPLMVRTRLPGDRIIPFGLRGTKKLQDVFVDTKVPACERERIPIFECNGQIVWLPGYSVADGWQVKDPSAPALQLEVTRISDSAPLSQEH